MIAPRLVDSHCHLNRLDLTDFDGDVDAVIQRARAVGVEHFLCVAVELADVPVLKALASRYPEVSISVGVHPNETLKETLSLEELIQLASDKACIALGETGLDYYRLEDKEGKANQQHQFRQHIQAGKTLSKPLIIHTREAAEDTIRILREENAEDIGGVMHCFTESYDVAKLALDLNFYISFSGILTFKNATQLQSVAQKVPLDRILIETDAPYLAPVPFRGKQNHPALVKHVAQALSALRNVSYETIAQATTDNFYRCFKMENRAVHGYVIDD